jgi:hypothetical protein
LEPTTSSFGFRKGRASDALLGLSVLVALASLPRSSKAELLYFKNGGQIQAPATFDGNLVTIELPEGSSEFLRDDFRKLVPGFVPEREWEGRLRQSRTGGFSARYDALWWALENGLTSQAVAQVQELHTLDPRHGPTARMAAATSRLERPCSDPDAKEFRKALGVPTSVARGPHILLFHQQTEAEAAQRVALLEQVMISYYLVFAAQGIELKVPERRLVFGWFASQTDYLAFLHAQDADAFATTRGYFHPTWNAVVAYDSRSSDRQRTGHESSQARREELKEFRATVDRLPPGAKLRVTLTGDTGRVLGRASAIALADQLDREVRREDLLLDLERSAFDDGTATHELIHLLVANSGLVPSYNAFPVWLQEGLATQFELMRGGRWAGIGRAHDIRLPDWRQIQPAPSLEPLVRDVGFGRGYRRDSYASAWSLVYFLRSRHSAEFLTFIDLLRSPDTALDELSPSDRTLSAFRRAFVADLEPLEREWREFMKLVQTSLELHAPPAEAPSQRRTPPRAAARRQSSAPRSTN